MTIEEIKYELNRDWSDEQDITASKIAKVCHTIAILCDEQPSNTLCQNNKKKMLSMVQLLDKERKTLIKDELEQVKNKYLKEQNDKREQMVSTLPLEELIYTDISMFEEAVRSRESKQTKEAIIKINLGLYYDDFTSGSDNQRVKTLDEALIIGGYILAHTTGASKDILSQMDMKDTNHYNRDKKHKKNISNTFYQEKKSEKEYWNVTTKSLYENLLSCGTGDNRANRLATKTIKIIRKINENT